MSLAIFITDSAQDVPRALTLWPRKGENRHMVTKEQRAAALAWFEKWLKD